MNIEKQNPSAANAGALKNIKSDADFGTAETKAETSAKQVTKPPSNTLFADGWDDLPDTTHPAAYRIEGQDQTFTVRKKTRQVLEALMRQPVACASRCRISDRVLLLRRDNGLTIKMTMFPGDGTSQGEAFGVYFLKSEIERAEEATTGRAA